MDEPVMRVPSLRVGKTGTEATHRLIPDEVPVALVYDGSTHAVMMATPANLEDFAVGFSLNEGVVKSAAEIREIEIVEHEIGEHGTGLEARMWLTPDVGRTHAQRRRRIAGPTACGLCGVESLEAAVPVPPRVGTTLRVSRSEIEAALAAMPAAQTLNLATRAVHAAAFWSPRTGKLAALCEDVGRHNALDKLAGRLARTGLAAREGIVLLTSRVSVEMVQKTAAMGAEILVAVSAPTSLALRTAEAAGLSLVAVARADAFEIFTHPERIALADNNTDLGDHRYALV